MSITVLYTVNKCLSDMNSFQVNSIDGTEESLQVASIVEDKYYAMVNSGSWPAAEAYLQLDTSPELAGPTTLSIPLTVDSVNHLRYRGLSLKHVEPEVFLQTALDPSNADNENMTLVQMGSTVQGYVLTNKAPQFFTTFDDELIICDSYDSVAEDKLLAAESLAKVFIRPTFILDDASILAMPQKMEALFLAECRAAAFKKIKQQVSDEDERDRRLQRSRLQNDARKQQDKDRKSKTNGFGRNGGQRSSSTSGWWSSTND